MENEKLQIRQSEPGDAGYVAFMHGRFYHKYHGFHGGAEYYFIKHLADFVRDPNGSKLWIAETGGTIVGSAAIVYVEKSIAQLRWFFVEPEYQNKGIGNKLMQTALDFCRENNYQSIFLWTFMGLDAARHIYDKAGFTIKDEKPNGEWSSVEIIEQKMELHLKR